jgi:hypothetical protein
MRKGKGKREKENREGKENSPLVRDRQGPKGRKGIGYSCAAAI